MNRTLLGRLSWLVRVALLVCLGYLASASGSHATDQEFEKLLDVFREAVERLRTDSVDVVDDRKLIDAAIRGMLWSVDPYAEYFNPGQWRTLPVLVHSVYGDYGEPGVEFTARQGALVVVAPLDGTPAEKAGLRAQDVITHVDGKSLAGLSERHAWFEMLGRPGTPVVLTVRRPGRTEPFDVSIIRVIRRFRSVRSRLEKDVGYIKISAFGESTAKALESAISKLQEASSSPLNGYVLDLRNNPGGLIEQVAKVADVFLDQGEVVRVLGRTADKNWIIKAKKGGMLLKERLVVLINGGTADVAEVLAGTLQDHNRATVLGTRSFRKGWTQHIIPLGKDAAMRITTGRHHTPLGRSIEREGIEPDIVVNQDGANTRDPQQDNQLQAALELVRTGAVASNGDKRTYRN